ncbi:MULTISPECIES: hypothetical protein [unclassified Microbacterium]|uniref:hypothetical protein n=1 Tax=unclassified Microbacterium TaxID=2609290 RepID=UPI000C2C5A0A|nr:MULTISPECIES: hypothetical protein [unclassified Microbacterium]
MPQTLRFPDYEARDDFLTFASRASRLSDPEVRLEASGGKLAMWAPILVPRGLLDRTPTILALRALPVDPELVCDLVVTASSVTADGADATAAQLPPTAVRATWAGISAPRGGWTPVRTIESADVAARAHEGMARVAELVPTDAGAEAIQRVRSSVWGEPVEAWAGVPLGAGFAAVALGFIVGSEQVQLLSSGAWARLSFARGHVLVRGATLAV